MKHVPYNSILLILFGLFLVLQAGQLHAQEPTIIYLYNDLGRLLRVINENNECATYTYDAVGNILSITRATNCLQPPAIESLSQETAKAGDTVCMTITGTNFLGATVTTDNPEVQITRMRVTETSIEVCLVISLFSAIGPTKITITTPAGSVERSFNIELPNPTIITQNELIASSG
ncbi:MAG: RHS repeat protein [candidate division NC10 bacterium]|nr:RHS repeat protein [candidate division NC10 bacterium]